jgi:carboxymethylenebutenolidase
MTDRQPIGDMVDLSSYGADSGGSPNLRGYAVRPPGQERLPGVVVIHEAFGPDEVNQRSADRVADLGYAVVMPDLFSDGGPRQCLKATFEALRSGHGRAFQDIAAARQWLLDRDDATGDVGIIGFCMGGGFALVCAAPTHGFGVSSVNYGQLPASGPDVLAGACPIVASYGRRDLGLRGAAVKLEYHLTRLGVPHDVKEYPKASHQFLNQGRNGPWALKALGRIAGIGPEPESAADAWQRIGAFFAVHLRR